MLRNWARFYANQTEPEKKLEPDIAKLGRRYRSQHPFFWMHAVSNFALLDDKIVIEVDGKSHQKPEQIYKDIKHTLALAERGWRVVRCTNEEVMYDPEGTLVKLLERASVPHDLEALRSLLARTPAPVKKPPVARKSKRKLEPSPRG